ncbi:MULTISPECIES: TrbG/VirB9 family P-type conjugative transfer protein [Burkholderia]|jgi:type IV secretion system protein VirB9|uniref:TrbG/VirB9 family P-type conjugative transfer protein n=3 Tax=Bacteria TaxID=2 RepID=A0A1E3FN64_9BURK|nr:TrbG/VirB9 family P-type conjugative transfer protein [Burkholderia contaminans]ELK7724876.1 TrbG/VirB9 family P-type conjugative transfer protein [Burkholderia cenocepacia]UTP27818.1 TrbG/VirB9 family P-type conjugative transfer protein [Burkholderia sp. FXe9]HBN6128178.1 TrbG/VirB9 family P-type conjugative transfer protein [Clostridioides difficile]MBA9833413.1 conjugal transfer protein TrbG [Burkholderia contaminans]MBH9693785.1 TrbG/VirB9 family P-type conjugative transfer protein [Bur
MKIRTLRIAALIAMFACEAAHALTVPESSPQDKHLQVVPFTSDVIAVQGKVGMMTRIRFGEGETVIDYGMGDKSAWTVKYSGNQIAFVPKAVDGDTNLLVITNRHEYWFSVAMSADSFELAQQPDESSKKKRASAKKAHLPTTWQLNIDYPLAERQAVAASDPKVKAVKAKARFESAFERAKREGRLDADYGYIGPDELLPTAAYNNGELTFILFPSTIALPQVYEKGVDGVESRVASHMEGDMLVVHTVVRKLIIRRGRLAGCLIDGQFNPSGANTNTYTISPDVQRVLNPAGEEAKAGEEAR